MWITSPNLAWAVCIRSDHPSSLQFNNDMRVMSRCASIYVVSAAIVCVPKWPLRGEASNYKLEGTNAQYIACLQYK